VNNFTRDTVVPETSLDSVFSYADLYSLILAQSELQPAASGTVASNYNFAIQNQVGHLYNLKVKHYYKLKSDRRL